MAQTAASHEVCDVSEACPTVSPYSQPYFERLNVLLSTQPPSIPDLFYLIWETPKYRDQVTMIDTILQKITTEEAHALLMHTISAFHNICVDRRDKFYYLISKTFQLIPFSDIFKIKNTDVQEYVCHLLDTADHPGWEDAAFVEFFCYARPSHCMQFKTRRVDESLIREALKRNDIPSQNRQALYDLIK